MADKLSQSDEDLLADGMAAVFVLVAGSDGGIDKKERKRFTAMLESADTASTGVLPAVLKRAMERTETSIAALQGAEAEVTLQRVGRAAREVLSEPDSERYLQGLVHMADAIAGASGGGILGLKNPVDSSEQAAMRRLRELLEYDTD